MKQKIKILLLDDHAMVRQGLQFYFSTDERLEVVATIACVEDVKALEDSLYPDVALIDLHLADQGSGIEATRQIKSRWPSCEVVILTSYHQDDLILAAFEVGALGYLIKDIEPEALIAAVVKAVDGQAVFSPVIANKLLTLTSVATTPHLALSDRELQVLKLIAQGYNNSEIATQCFINIKTVRTHVSNILSKLQLRDRTQLAIHAWRKGLIDPRIG